MERIHFRYIQVFSGTRNTITYEAWIYPRSYPSEGAHNAWIVGQRVHLGGAQLLILNNGKIQWLVADGSKTGQYYLDSTLSIPLNKWAHIVGTFDGSTMRLYVDGKEANIPLSAKFDVIWDNTYIYSGGTFYKNTEYRGSFVGKDESGWFSGFNGIIDEVRIYNRALSDSEIKANYEDKQTTPLQLTLTKSISPSTITEGDSTTVTIRVENTGGDAKSVKITDVVPQGFTLVSGIASQEYATLKATESRTFQYTIKATGTGRFVSDLATVTYQDEKGNSYYSGASNSATITVQADTSAQSPQQQAPPAAQPKTPGFGVILAGIGIISVLALRRR